MIISESNLILLLCLMPLLTSLLVILLIIFTTLEAKIVRQKKETTSSDLRVKTEVDEKHHLDQECFRRDSLSASSISSEASSVFRHRMNSQEAVEKMLHMLADPTTSRRNSYQEAISMFSGKGAKLRLCEGSRRTSWPTLDDSEKHVPRRQKSKSLSVIM